MKKRFSCFLSVFLIIGLLCSCGNDREGQIASASSESEDTVTMSKQEFEEEVNKRVQEALAENQNSTAETVPDETPDPEKPYFPLKLKSYTKQYNVYSNETDYTYTLTFENVSNDILKNPGCVVNCVRSDGGTVFLALGNFVGTIAPGQTFDIEGYVSDKDSNWDDRDNVVEFQLQSYFDDSGNYDYDEPFIFKPE